MSDEVVYDVPPYEPPKPVSWRLHVGTWFEYSYGQRQIQWDDIRAISVPTRADLEPLALAALRTPGVCAVRVQGYDAEGRECE